MSQGDEEPASAPPDSIRQAARERRALTAKGPLAWMTQNSVASNLLMIVLLVGGMLTLSRIKQEVFPQFELDVVVVNVAYPGASPSEVEQGVVLALEEAVRGVDGVKEVNSTSKEGVGVVTVELELGADADRALADVKSATDRITSFPQDVERPVISLATNRSQVVNIIVSGEQSEATIREVAERIRGDLLRKDGVTVVDLAGVRPPEISIDVPQAELRRFGVTLEDIANRVRAASVDLPGGGVKTSGGEVLVRTTERRMSASEFEDIVILSRPDGSEVHLGEMGEVKDGFRENDQQAFFNGKRAAMVKVYQVGDQTPLAISKTVQEYVEQNESLMPPGIELATWADISEMYEERLDLMLRNSYLGLILVVLILGLFLELRLALWVTLGIPISFVGALLFMPSMDVSINMISLFAFIVTLGMVVDDAIVVGEAIYKRRTEGASLLHAAIGGVREVATPVVFAILTTIIAFMPMLFVPGPAGKFFRLIPLVVIAVLLISLVESLLILPAHLAHSKPSSWGIIKFIHDKQQRFSRGVEWFIENTYVPFLRRAVQRRYLTLAVCVSLLIATMGLRAGGRLDFTFMPKVDGDVIVAELELPFGSPVAGSTEATQRMVALARKILEERGGEANLSRGIFAQVGQKGSFRGGLSGMAGSLGGSHEAEVAVFIVPLDRRSFTSTDFAREWRERIGEVAGMESLKFFFSTGPSAGNPVDIELAHEELDVLERASTRLASELGDYAGVYAIDDGFSAGKEQLDFKLTPQGRSLGITEAELARQVRHAFFGAEAVRQQRGRDELRAYVRLPTAERLSEYDIESLLIRPPGGGEIPVAEAATIQRGRAYTEIKRRDGRRVVSVTADVDGAIANANEVVPDVVKKKLPTLLADFGGLSYSLQGEQREQANTMGSLGSSFVLAIIAIFALLAVAFRSYVQPLIIMMVIPFGLIGAVIGHVIMGYDMSLMTMMGVVALSGVVVNDSLILVVAVNRYREDGMSPFGAVVAGGGRRFRPIILTSLTTFFGLVPMILETSVQARFLIPMAISLGFGVLFATVITLVLVPSLYLVVIDVKHGLRLWFEMLRRPAGTRAAPLPGE